MISAAPVGPTPRSSAAAAALTALLALAGCPDDRPAAARDAAVERDSRAPTPASRPAFAHCAALTDPPAGSLRPLRLGGQRLVPRRFRLAPARAARGPRRLVLGVLGDTKQALAGTLENLARLRRRFARRGVDATVVLGGIDPTFEGTRRVLRQLAGPRPLLALPGDRASQSGFAAAVRELGHKAIDLSLARVIEHHAVTLLSVPGYFLPHHLLAKEQGCSYEAGELDALAAALRDTRQPRLLLSHGPPRGRGPAAVDRAFGAVNIGDPALRRLMSRAGVAFGVFAHVHEAAGHATNLAGARVEPNSWSESLLLNVGSADAVPHQDLAGRWSRGTAAIVEFLDGRARYRMIHLRGAPAAKLKPLPVKGKRPAGKVPAPRPGSAAPASKPGGPRPARPKPARR